MFGDSASGEQLTAVPAIPEAHRTDQRETPPRSVLIDVLAMVAVAMVGTVNLWKVQTLQDLVPLDLTLVAILAAILAVLSAVVSRGLRIEKHWLLLVVSFLLFVPPALWANPNSPYSTSKVQNLFTVVLLVVAAPMMLVTTDRRRSILVAVLAGLGLALSCALLLAGSATVEGRVEIDSANPISLSRIACLSFVILGVAALRWHGIARLSALTGMALSVVGAVSTGSRGPVASAVAAVLLVALLTRRHQSRAAVTGGVIGLAVAVWQAISQFAPDSALERYATAGFADAQREHLLTESALVAFRHPWGVGWGNLADYLSAQAIIPIQGRTQYSHNVIAEVAAEGGVLALLGLVIVLVASWRRLYAAANTVTGQALLAAWVLAVGSAMTSSDITGNRLMWMMIGVGLAYPVVARVPKNCLFVIRTVPDRRL